MYQMLTRVCTCVS